MKIAKKTVRNCTGLLAVCFIAAATSLFNAPQAKAGNSFSLSISNGGFGLSIVDGYDYYSPVIIDPAPRVYVAPPPEFVPARPPRVYRAVPRYRPEPRFVPAPPPRFNPVPPPPHRVVRQLPPPGARPGGPQLGGPRPGALRPGGPRPGGARPSGPRPGAPRI